MPKKTITRTRQYLRGSAICLRSRSCRDFTIIREKYKVLLQCFSLSLSLSQETRQQQTLISKLRFLHPTHRIHNGLQNRPKFFLRMSAPAWACQPKPSLHGLSLRKSPFKNHATLFVSGQVVKPDQTKLSSTKPNKFSF